MSVSLKVLLHKDLVGLKRNQSSKEFLNQSDAEDDQQLPLTKRKKQFCLQESLVLRQKHFAENVAKFDYSECMFKIVSAKGQYMYDDNGSRYLDMRNNVHHVGHCHPKVIEACIKQMSLLNTNSRFLHDEMLLLAKRMTKTLPEKLCVCFFTNSGSEANDLALQIAERVSGGTDIISVNGGYHGHLKSLRGISTHPMSGQDHSADYSHLVSLPDVYRGKYRDSETAASLYAQEVKEVIENCTKNQKKIAGFIVEPIICCGGQIVPPDGYLKEAFDHVHSAGGLCIADEVQSGYGRIGSHFWAFELQGVVPDIITIGKPMGNGHPVAAVITTKEIADKFAATGIEYFNTFGGNPVSMAVSNAVLDVLEDEHLQENAKTVGKYLAEKLCSLKEIHHVIGDVRGVGLMIGVEFVKDRITKEPATEQTTAIKERLVSEYKILTITDGLDKNVLKIKPPICISKQDIDYFISSLDAVLSTIN